MPALPFRMLYKLLRCACLHCFHLKMPRKEVDRFRQRLTLLQQVHGSQQHLSLLFFQLPEQQQCSACPAAALYQQLFACMPAHSALADLCAVLLHDAQSRSLAALWRHGRLSAKPGLDMPCLECGTCMAVTDH